MEKIDLTIENGVKTITVLSGQAPRNIEAQPVEIKGTIEAPYKFLCVRKELIEIGRARLMINREALSISLIYNEDSDLISSVIGELKFTEEYKSFGINSGTTWISQKLGEFIKMNRTCFESRQIANELSAKLIHFKAKVEKDLESKDDKRGNYIERKEQSIKDVNIPEKFELSIPIFKGTEKTKIEVEIYINRDDLSISLVSPDAADIIKQVRDESIDSQEALIHDLCSELAIIEL